MALIRYPGLPNPLRLKLPPSADELLDRFNADVPDAAERIPYWADLWPAADALVRFLCAGRGPRRPGPSLEIGCGLGLVGICAASMGWDIQISDRDPDAVAWLKSNLALNRIAPERAFRLDWMDPPPARWKTILASDILYEKRFADQLASFLTVALLPGGRALIAEPGRGFTEPAMALLRERFSSRLHHARGRDRNRWRSMRILELKL